MWNRLLKRKNSGQISIGFATDRGNVRQRNEDSLWFAVDGTEAICMIADGVGGCAGGEYASATAAKAVARYWKKSHGLSGLRRIFEESHAEIRGYSHKTKEKSGTTLSVLYCNNSEFAVAHAGDSRIYRVSKNMSAKIELLTQDDTWVAEKMREGVITPQEAIEHPKRHTLTNCLGGFQNCRVFESKGQIGANDVYLLCSDGLYGYIEERELKRILSKCVVAQKTTDKLMQLALSRGGEDNISLIIVKYH